MVRRRRSKIAPAGDQWARLRDRSRVRVLVLIVVAVALLAATLLAPLMAPAPAPAAVPGAVLPDLVSDPPSSPLLQVYDFGGGNTRLLLRFTGYVHNAGDGALDMRGSQRSGTRMTSVAQRLYLADGVAYVEDASRSPEMLFEQEDGHNHWHLKDAARYSLWNQSKTAQVAPAMKVGFCLEDSELVGNNGPSSRVYTSGTTSFCEGGNPGASSVYQGISAGWRDIYSRNLPFQWVDVSDTIPGVYYLRNEADPNDVMIETDETNPGGFMSSSTSVPGYVAKPIAAGTFAVNDPRTITLDAQKFGGPGARVFRIESGPSHGNLNHAAGASFGSSTVTYTPERWYRGPDSFTYSALDSTSAYPRQPVRATVAFSVDGTGPGIALAAPQSVAVGTSVQLTASEPDVTWSVDGTPGGGPTVGTISASGLYTAPALVPLGGKVTVTARTPAGAEGGVQIQIVPAPTPQPAPAAADPAALAPKGKRPSTIGRPRITRNGKLLLVTLRARRAGLIRVWAWNMRKTKRRKLGFCRAKTPKLRTMTCRLKLPPGVHTRDVEVTVSLRVRGKVVAVRHAGVRRTRASAHGGHSHRHHHEDHSQFDDG